MTFFFFQIETVDFRISSWYLWTALIGRSLTCIELSDWSSSHTWALIMLFNQHLDLPQLSGGRIVSLTDFNTFLLRSSEKWFFCVDKQRPASLTSTCEEWDRSDGKGKLHHYYSCKSRTWKLSKTSDHFRYGLICWFFFFFFFDLKYFRRFHAVLILSVPNSTSVQTVDSDDLKTLKSSESYGAPEGTRGSRPHKKLCFVKES